MKITFSPNEICTREACPVCGEISEVEHGHAAVFDSDGNAVIDSGKPWHLWHCPKCGDSLSAVLYGCQDCAAIVEAEEIVK
jgi:predicted RNA-binding Zn-ribbon protein involved in translation (DUF1610 family)